MKPLRHTIPNTARLLSIGVSKLRQMVAEGQWTVSRDRVKKGSRIYLLSDEIEIYANGGLEALQSYRRKMGRIKEIKEKEKQ